MVHIKRMLSQAKKLAAKYWDQISPVHTNHSQGQSDSKGSYILVGRIVWCDVTVLRIWKEWSQEEYIVKSTSGRLHTIAPVIFLLCVETLYSKEKEIQWQKKDKKHRIKEGECEKSKYTNTKDNVRVCFPEKGELPTYSMQPSVCV